MSEMMKKFQRILNESAWWGAVILAMAMMGLVTFQAYRYRFNDYDSNPVYDNILLQLLAFFAVAGAVRGLGKLLERAYRRWHFLDKILLAVTMIGTAAFCILFLKGAKILPCSDAKAVFDIAIWMSEGNMQAVVPRDSYLSLWPFQTGMIFIFEKMMLLFHTTTPLFFQMINVCFVELAILSGYGCLKQLTDRLDAVLLYLVLAGTNLPLLLGTYEIYGNIPSLALMMFATWMLMVFADKDGILGWGCGVLGCLATVVAGLYRQYTLIYAIALVIVFFLIAINQRKWKKLILILVTMLLCNFSTTFTQKYYEYYAQNTCGKGVPMVAYLAMGMQDVGGIPGGWNGFHSNLYMETGYDYEETSRISRESIAQSGRYFKEHPDVMWDFYYRKVRGQWGNQTNSVYWGMDSLYGTPQSDFSVSLIRGQGKERVVYFMNYWQSIVYTLICLSLLGRIAGKRNKTGYHWIELLPMITFIGGFLFLLIWEAQPIYVRTFQMLLLPVEIGSLQSGWKNVRSNIKK